MEAERKVELRPIGQLVPYAGNARSHSAKQVEELAASITEFGFVSPLLIDENNLVLAGHGRLLAAKELQLPAVPCVLVSGLTEKQKRAYIIADNKLALNATWDYAMLSSEMLELRDLQVELDVMGWTADEMDIILNAEWTPPKHTAPVEKPKKLHSIRMSVAQWSAVAPKVMAKQEELGSDEATAVMVMLSEYQA